MPGLFDGLNEAAGKLQDLGNKVVEGAKELVENARPAVEEGFATAKEKVSEGVETAKTFVENLTAPKESASPDAECAPAAKAETPLDALDQINAEAKDTMDFIRASRTAEDPISAFMRAKEKVQEESAQVIDKVTDAAEDTKAAVIENMEKAKEHAEAIAKDAGEALDSLKESLASLGKKDVIEEAAAVVEAPVEEIIEEIVEEVPVEVVEEPVEETIEEIAGAEILSDEE